MSAKHCYQFGPYRLDAAEKLLYRDSAPVPLTPKAVDALLLLVAKHGHVVEKDELLKRLWPDTFVEEGSLSQIVFCVRKALSDGMEGKQYVETVPKRGYRFIAPVEEPPPVDAPAAPGRLRPRLPLVLAAALPGVVIAAAGWWLFWRPAPEGLCTHPRDLGANRVTALREFKGGVLAVYHQPARGSPWAVFLSRDVRSLDMNDTANTAAVYSGPAHVEHLAVTPNGVLTTLYRPGRKPAWEVYRSPDGRNLGGGGNTVKVYQGTARVDALVPFRTGVLTALYGPAPGDNRGIYYSPDGENLDGGGHTVKVYLGRCRVEAMVAYQEGVVTAFHEPAAGESCGIFYSPDGHNLGGGGDTVRLHLNPAGVQALAVTASGVLAAFWNPQSGKSRVLYLDGPALAGRGKGTVVWKDQARIDAMLAYRDGVITAFYGPVFAGGVGVYFSPDGQNLAGGGSTLNVHLKKFRVAAIGRVGAGLLTAFYEPVAQTSAGIYFSPDGLNLSGGAATVPVAP